MEYAFTVDHEDNEQQAFEAAKAYGKFQKYLSDFNLEDCHETIPNFHNLSNRLERFNQTLQTKSSERLEKAKLEINKVGEYKYLEDEFQNLLELNLPRRITHNDTKINNVMLDKETKEGLCVLDLDTVMPGSILDDYGDMVRSFVSRAQEDDRDYAKVEVRLNIFEAMTSGYLGELKDVLTFEEINNLVLGAKIIVYEQAIRFLTDFIEGDIYYKVDYQDHNLDRTKNQFALLASIEDKSDEMKKIVDKYC
ncbi:MAG: phosphotransferase [Melioribacteraceae bacterium]|nr:phosphotransferase [Melioribacteraceae bacterium]